MFVTEKKITDFFAIFFHTICDTFGKDKGSANDYLVAKWNYEAHKLLLIGFITR